MNGSLEIFILKMEPIRERMRSEYSYFLSLNLVPDLKHVCVCVACVAQCIFFFPEVSFYLVPAILWALLISLLTASLRFI